MLFCAELQAEENKKNNYKMDLLIQLFLLLPLYNAMNSIIKLLFMKRKSYE